MWWIRRYQKLLYENPQQAVLPQMARIARTQPRVETRVKATIQAAPRPLPIWRKYKDPGTYHVSTPYGIGAYNKKAAEGPGISEKLAGIGKSARRELASHRSMGSLKAYPAKVARAADLETEWQFIKRV